jgi:ABC-type amino acid transport substrate-binding protein
MNKKVSGNLGYLLHISFFFLSLCFLLIGAMASKASELAFEKMTRDAGTQQIINSGELRLAIIKRENPPFYYSDPNGVDGTGGLEVELGKKIAKELGVKLRIIRKTDVFNELVKLVARGEADIAMSKLSISLPRASFVEYAQPYINFRKAILINRLKFAELKNATKDSIYEFFNRKDVAIGVIANSSYETFAKQLFPNGKVIGFDSWDSAVEAVAKGEVSGIFRDEFEISRTLRNIPDGAIKFMSVILKEQEDPIAMVLPWNKLHFKNWINHFLNSKSIAYENTDILEMLENYDKEHNKA